MTDPRETLRQALTDEVLERAAVACSEEYARTGELSSARAAERAALLAALLPHWPKEPEPQRACWHGHTTRRMGCVSCVLVFDLKPSVGMSERVSAGGPIPLNAEQMVEIKAWAADDRLWTTQETVEINLTTFARSILKHATIGQNLLLNPPTIGRNLSTGGLTNQAALVSAPPVAASTCATCKHWCAGRHQGEEMREYYVRNGWAAECGQQGTFRSMFTVYVYGDGRVDDYEFETPPSFGCTLHEPAPTVTP